MDITLTPAKKCINKIEAISSKSYVHRLLIAAALSDKISVVKTNILSEDMKATIDCLNAMGADIKVEDKNIYVNPIAGILSGKKCEKAHLNPNESGSTARFLLPVASVLCKQFTMEGHGKLPQRPLGPVCQCMRANGAEISSDFIPLEVSGELRPGTYELPGNISSQYITGLMYALPVLKGDSDIMLTTELESKAYIDITLDVLNMFGIRVVPAENGYHIPGNQKYIAPDKMQAQGDWSNAAFFLCMGAIAGEITVTEIDATSPQGDKEILNILKKFGAEVTIEETSVTVKKKELKAIRAEVSEIPDLVPVMCVVAALAEGTTVFENAGRLRIKESDRIETTKALLQALGADLRAVEEDGKVNLYIDGVKEYTGGEVDSAGDHRIAMSAAVATVRATAPVIIRGAEAVNKSYPGFFEDYKRVLIYES